MPLDVAVAPKTLTSMLHYLKRGIEKPAYYRIEPPPGVPRSNGNNDPHEVTIEDARGRESEFTLDRNGFALIKAPTAMTDFYSPDEIKRVYYPEIERLVRDHLGADAEELLKHRFGIVNVWRPVRGPVLDSPLALCDAQSFTDDDLIASDLVYAHVRGETSRVAFNPAHRWYYFSEMQTDEVLFIRVHDSADDGRARLSFHTSFENPLTPGAPPRESIEVRTLVFFPPAG
jgi:hypothetical protein